MPQSQDSLFDKNPIANMASIPTTLYHGTAPFNVYSIASGGFQIGEIYRGREQSRGLYLSTLAGAVEYGDYLVKCRLARGTRFLKHSVPDKRTIEYLKSGFGTEILKPDFYKVIPKNKQLKKNEMIELFNYLIVKYVLVRFPIRWKRHSRFKIQLHGGYAGIYDQLRRYKFDGIAINFPDYPLILMFNPSRVIVLSVHTWSLRPGIEWPQLPLCLPDEAFILSEPIRMSELKAIEEIAKEKERADAKEYPEIEESVKRTFICGSASGRKVRSRKR